MTGPNVSIIQEFYTKLTQDLPTSILISDETGGVSFRSYGGDEDHLPTSNSSSTTPTWSCMGISVKVVVTRGLEEGD